MLSEHRKRPVETVVGNGQFRDAGGGTGMTDWGWKREWPVWSKALDAQIHFRATMRADERQQPAQIGDRCVQLPNLREGLADMTRRSDRMAKLR